MRRIYLACPYSHTLAHVRTYRYGIATDVAGHLFAAGHAVFSPITHCHPIAELHILPGNFAFWRAYDLSFVDLWATEMMVLTLPGWEESIGVQEEIRRAWERGLPTRLLDHATREFFHE